MNQTKKIIILGTGGNCIDILDAIQELNAGSSVLKYECVGFLDDDKDKWGKVLFGVKVLGPLGAAPQFSSARFVNGIGSETNFWNKEAIIAGTNVPLDRFETIAHPSASVSKMSAVGSGTVILQNATVASGAKIGNHVIILPNAVVSHDDVVGDFTSITGGVCISGGVTVGKSCYLGTNSSIIGGVSIGDFSLVGMGSVVIGDIEENSVVAGNPAKFLRKTKP